eukprot:1147367-Pelagomonas_calceolata.AAC.10
MHAGEECPGSAHSALYLTLLKLLIGGRSLLPSTQQYVYQGPSPNTPTSFLHTTPQPTGTYKPGGLNSLSKDNRRQDSRIKMRTTPSAAG